LTWAFLLAAAAATVPQTPGYSVTCRASTCLVSSAELSFEVLREGDRIRIKPLTFTPTPAGMFAERGMLTPSQFRFVPDYLWPKRGHYLVGPGDTVIEYRANRESIWHLTLDQFLARIRRSARLHVTVFEFASMDLIGSDHRTLRTGPFVRAIERARTELMD
jgi:hypothetical protein